GALFRLCRARRRYRTDSVRCFMILDEESSRRAPRRRRGAGGQFLISAATPLSSLCLSSSIVGGPAYPHGSLAGGEAFSRVALGFSPTSMPISTAKNHSLLLLPPMNRF